MNILSSIISLETVRHSCDVTYRNIYSTGIIPPVIFSPEIDGIQIEKEALRDDVIKKIDKLDKRGGGLGEKNQN